MENDQTSKSKKKKKKIRQTKCSASEMLPVGYKAMCRMEQNQIVDIIGPHLVESRRKAESHKCK